MLRRTLLAAGLALSLVAPAALAQSTTGTTPPVPTLPPSIHWAVLPANPCPEDSIRLVIDWCELCIHVQSVEITGPASARVTFLPSDVLGCPSDSCPRSFAALSYGTFAPGGHVIDIELDAIVHTSSDSDTTLISHVPAPFFVRSDCGGFGTLPFVDTIEVAGASSPLPCPGDSIRVTVLGHFPNDCYFVRRVEWFQPVCIAWPCLPILRVLVDDGGCLARPCIQVVTPWEAKASLPPLPTGAYSLLTQLAVVSCSDSFPPDSVHSAGTPFRVGTAEECGIVAPPCVALSWPHGVECDAVFDTTGRTSLVLRESCGVPIAGLQGALRLSSDALRIESIAPVGAASGMLLTWNATATGADWVLFSKGAPLPPSQYPAPPNEILRVGVATRPGMSPPATSTLGVPEAFASDSLGNEVPLCPEPRITEIWPPPSFARLCLERPCDANGDGRSDVRDLVLMVRCLHYSCPDSARYDCDADGDFGIDDVLCCARRILHRDTHDTTGARPAPDVHVTLDAPRETPSGWVLPVHLTGTGTLGGARLEIAYPAERFTVSGLTQAPGAESWLSLWDTDAGALVLGLLNMADPRVDLAAPGELTVEVQLALRPGWQPGGSVAISAGEFSALDGTPLSAPVEHGAIPVVTPSKLALSGARPNPFSAETRFSLDLDRGAQVEVTVHDLSGRRVATLLRGALPAGRHSLSWNGASDGGARAAEGLYFVRCVADGRVVSQKVAILRQK